MFFRMNKKSKKAAMKLSIKAIVVLIIAITVLGLGFIKNLFGSAMGSISDFSFVYDAEVLTKAKESGELVYMENISIQTRKGTTSELIFVVTNNDSSPKKFGVIIECVSKKGDPAGCDTVLANAWFNIFQNIVINGGDAKVFPISMNPKESGEYMFSVKVYHNDETNDAVLFNQREEPTPAVATNVWGSKDLYINVK